MNNLKEITVGYWSTKGLGSVCRQMVVYAGVPLKAKMYKLEATLIDGVTNYDGSSWHDINKIELKKTNSLINLPYIELLDSKGDSLVISQSNACLMHLARKFNMFGQNEIEVSQCEQLLFETGDLRNIITSFAYTHFPNKDKEHQSAKDVFNRTFDNNNTGKKKGGKKGKKRGRNAKPSRERSREAKKKKLEGAGGGETEAAAR